MTEGLDDGPIIFQQEFLLDGSLDDIFNRIVEIGTIGTIELVENISNLKMIKQDSTKATIYKRRKSYQSEIKPDDFLKYDAKYFNNFIRSLQKPYPLPFIRCKNNTKLYLKDVKDE